MKKGLRLRLRFLAVVVILMGLFIVFELYVTQIINGEKFLNQANRQYANDTGRVYDRGTIFFEKKDGGKIAAASLTTGYTLYITPKEIIDATSTADKLLSVIDIDNVDFIYKASKPNDPYEEILKRVPKEFADKIEALKLSGVHLHEDKWRYYPANELAAHALGFVSFKGDEEVGTYGLERQYESELKRSAGGLYDNFFIKLFSGINDFFVKKNPLEANVVTTIEPTIQTELENEIKKLNERWAPAQIGAIVIEPKTGEIYAMASSPTFDPNNFRNVINPGVFSNPLVESVYEMGSTVKPLTVAIGLDTNSINASTQYDDKGSLTLDGKTIWNYDKKARGVITVQEALGRSLNVGMAFVEQKIGNNKYAKYLTNNFGLKEKTGIDLPNEGDNLLKNLESPRNIEYATASYGQGIAFTPISMVRALSSLSNGGTLITPHLAKRFEYRVGINKDVEIKEGPRAIDKSTSEEITRMLVKVFDDYLLEGSVKLPHYSIAGKTGTAQIADPYGGYYDDRNLHSFFGYFPAFDPKFLVFFYMTEPKNVEYASQTLTSPFMNMANFLINYYNIPPDR